MNDLLIERLFAASSGIETVFSFIAESYPRLLKEVGLSRDYADNLVVQYGAEANSAGSRGQGSALGEVARDASEAILHEVALIDGYRKTEREELGLVKADIDRIVALERRIDEVIDITGGLEIIAMNSMIHALKVGSDGGGFSYIARELSTRTEETISMARILADTEAKLQSASDAFYGVSDTLNATGARLTDEIVGNIGNRLRGIEDTVRRIVNAVVDMSTSASGVKDPLYRIMESLQSQDIIHQSLEQVVTIVRSLPPLPETNGDQDLDDLTFIARAARVGASIVEETIQTLDGSRRDYLSHIDAVEDTISRLRGENTTMFNLYLSEDDGDPGQTMELVEGLESDRAELSTALRTLDDGTLELNEQGRRILAAIQHLNRASMDMVDSVDRYWHIIIAARMESVKQVALRGLDQTVNDMDSLVEKIGRIADEIATEGESIHHSAQPALANHERAIADIDRAAAALDEKLLGTVAKLHETTRGISADLCEFTVFSADFLDIFAESRNRIENLTLRSDELRQIRAEMDTLETAAAAAREQVLKERNLDDWELRDGRLQALVDDFTIFSNKRLAQDLAGSIIEEDRSQEGEVTLF